MRNIPFSSAMITPAPLCSRTRWRRLFLVSASSRRASASSRAKSSAVRSARCLSANPCPGGADGPFVKRGRGIINAPRPLPHYPGLSRLRRLLLTADKRIVRPEHKWSAAAPPELVVRTSCAEIREAPGKHRPSSAAGKAQPAISRTDSRRSLDPLWSGRSSWPRRSWRSIRSSRASKSRISRRPRRSLSSRRSGRALESLRPLDSLGPRRSLWSCGAWNSGLSLQPLRARISWRSSRSGRQSIVEA